MMNNANAAQSAAGSVAPTRRSSGPSSNASFSGVSCSGVSWGAIFAGSVTALVTQITLSMLGLGLGFASIDPASTGSPSAGTLSLAAALWWIGAGLLASLAGGYVAGRLCGWAFASRGGYHGLVSWAAATLVMLFLLGSAVGGVVGGAFGAMGGILGGAGRVVDSAVHAAVPVLAGSDNPMSDIERQIKSSGANQDPAQLRDSALNAIRAALTGDPAQQQQATDQAAQALAQMEGIPVDQAKAKVQDYQRQYTQTVANAKLKATQFADAAAKATSRVALIAFFALLLSAVASAAGGRFGAVKTRDEEYDRTIIR